MKTNPITRWLAAVFLLIGFSLSAAEPTTLAVQSGEKIAFLGDSITQAGAKKGGYVTLVMDALKQQGLDVSLVPAGIAGHRSNDMLATPVTLRRARRGVARSGSVPASTAHLPPDGREPSVAGRPPPRTGPEVLPRARRVRLGRGAVSRSAPGPGRRCPGPGPC